MRILAVAPYYDPEGGGLERYAHEVLKRLAARGHRVHALSFTRGRPVAAAHDGVFVERFAPLLRLGNTPIAFRFRRFVAAALREDDPDVVVAHTPVPFPAEMAFGAARRAGVPFVTTYHAGTLRGSSAALQCVAAVDRVTLERRMLAGSARLVAVSPYVRNGPLRGQRERVRVIMPGVDVERFSPGGPEAAVAHARVKGPSVLFVGPLDGAYRWKGIDTLWKAYRLVRRRLPRARLTLVGDGDRFDHFASLARRFGGDVRLAGRLADIDLVGEYRRASVIALPSVSAAESFGMVLAEANACGRPVVASRIGGVPDFVRDGDNGLLARPGDAPDLAMKLHDVLADEDLARALGGRGRARVVRDHAWAEKAEATEAVLAEAARQGAPEPQGRA